VSIVSLNSEGASVEIGLIGYEGMVGVPVILGGVMPYQAVVQMGGDAFRIRGRRLYEEFRQNPFLRDLLLRCTNTFLIQIAQSSLCNCYHTLQERFCRWLLVARDAVRGDVLVLTHDVIARLLGTRRASVTVAARPSSAGRADQNQPRSDHHPRPGRARNNVLRVLPHSS
jgi:hypothetical protein